MKIIEVLKRHLLILFAMGAAAQLQAAESPNVLFVMSDDLSYALSGAGHPECQTPHLDEFAKSAVSFSRAYTQFPLCAPSRASLMSGQYPNVNGVNGNGGKLDPERVTMPKHFQNHGYWSARVSKIYHMGIPRDILEGTNGSDHGYMIGEHEMYKKAKLWEEAIHVPLMISVPGQEGGKTCDQFVELVDLYPTLAELAGLPPESGCQGLSLTSLLEDPASERIEKPDALIHVSKGYGLRTGKWAFMHYPPKKQDPEAFMLYNMEKDPKQFTNLARHPEYAGKVKELRARLRERLEAAAETP